MFIGRTDAETEAPILWPPDAKNWLIGKDPDAEKDWRREEKGMTEDEMVGWMASPTQWTWVSINSGSWWWTGRPGMLRFMGSSRVGHDWVTELNWTELNCKEIKSVNSEYSLEGLMLKLKLQHFGHMKWKANPLKKTLMLGKTEGKRRRESQRMRWLDSITDSVDMNLSKLQEIVEDRGVWHAVVYRVAKSQT